MTQGIKNILTSGQQSISATGLCPSTSHSTRTCVLVRNNSADGSLYGKTKNGTGAPTISATNCEFSIGPGQWLVVPAGPGVGVWLVASSGSISVNYAEFDGDPAAVATLASTGGGASISGGSDSGAGVQAEDGSHSTGDSGMFVLGVRNDFGSAVTDTDGDYSAIAVDAAGRVNTNTQPTTLSYTTLSHSSDTNEDVVLNRCPNVGVILSSSGAGNRVSFLASRDGTTYVPIQARMTANGAEAETFDLVQNVAHGFQLGLVGFTTLRIATDVNAGTITGIVSPISFGSQFAGRAIKTFGGATATGTSNTSILSAPGSGYRWVVEAVQMSNSDSTAGGTRVTLKSGTNSLGQFYQVPASGGNNFTCEIRCNANEAFQFQSSDSRTTVSVNCTARKERV